MGNIEKRQPFYHYSKVQRPLAYLLVGIGLALLACAGWLTHQVAAPKSNHTPNPGSVQTPGVPSSEQIAQAAIDNHKVAPTAPKYVSIPAIGLSKTRVIGLGVMPNNQIKVPGNIHDLGWYEASSKPGQHGAMFIYGHLSAERAKGVFYSLKELKSDDRVIVTNGDDKIFTYKVVKTMIFKHNAVDMNEVLTSVTDGAGLNLMTCHGKIIPGSHDFEERLVVFTKAI